jgi:Uma2 family endonuclease
MQTDTLPAELIDEIPPRPPRRMTEEEFDVWDDDYWTGEWVDGELELMSPVSNQHAQLQNWFIAVLGLFVEARQLGEIRGPEFAMRMPQPRRRRTPDVMFIATDRLSLLTKTYLAGPPDLVVEIVSPESLTRDWRTKHQEYEAFGVREYWIVDSQQEVVEAYRRDAAGRYELIPLVDGRLASQVVPGWFLRPEWLWTQPPAPVLATLRELGVI